MLEVKNLSVNYGYIHALQGVSLRVEQQEIVSLIGSNGAGKTSTLMAVSGMVPKSGGSITFEGKEITHVSAHQIVRLGISHVPEGRHVFPKLSVRDNLVMGTIGTKKMDKRALLDQLEQVYTLFPRLKERQHQAGGTLSGGEQQMLAIGRGLMNRPKLLMLDEPSLGLAPIIIEEIFDLIVKIKKMGTTVLLIEQNAAMALSISDRGYVIENGIITFTGTGEELLQDKAVQRAYLGAED